MIVALINEKGGTGKTTLAVHLAAYLARERGRRVLLVDMDPQGQVGKTLGFPPRPEGGTVRDLFLDNAKPAALRRETAIANLGILPADKRLADVVAAKIHEPDGERLLERAFRRYRGDEVVVFDSPPSMGFLTRNILFAADRVVLPVALTYLALDGCAEMIQTVQVVQEAAGRDTPQVAAIVPTFRRPTRLAGEIVERLTTYFPDWLTGSLGFYVAVDEAQSHGQVIWDYRPGSVAAQAFATVCGQVADRLGL